MGIPTSTLSYAQKVFPFMENFGVGTFGAGQLAGQTMYFAIRELEQELKADETPVDSVTNAADYIAERASDLLDEDINQNPQAPNRDQIDDDATIVGFQVVGYNQDEPATVQVHIGSGVQKDKVTDPGCTWSGNGVVVQAIWGLYGQDQRQQPVYQVFSLQDAIEYARFLIRTTADHQNFSQQMANVGGDIDVALVTPFSGFQWIEQKSLNEKIDQRTHD